MQPYIHPSACRNLIMLNKVSLHAEPKKWRPPVGPKPVKIKHKKMVGLGRQIANQRAQENEVQVLPDGDVHFATDKKQDSWVKMRSITQESSLDEFLSTAQLAEHDFSADRRQQVRIVKVGNTLLQSTGVLTQAEMEQIRRKHQLFENRLTIPRRPQWRREMLKVEIERQENHAFLEWRRGLAALTELTDLILTPFERNIEVWRQLWRVVERCDVVVQIVDARAPTFFRSADLEQYVLLHPAKRNLLLVNKADMLTREQRALWAAYFDAVGVKFVFFSAANANRALETLESGGPAVETLESGGPAAGTLGSGGPAVDDEPPELRILRIEQLEQLFVSAAPPVEGRKLQIGLVGYPNVGKSLTINALAGLKKVSVLATPGKTKHFQTINLLPELVLCDCPGLVFPNFAYSNGELVCNGVLPIDQLREHAEPAELVCLRIPKFFLEAVYGIHIPVQRKEDGGGDHPTARELLNAYARARGYMTQGHSGADEPRAARYILKDYVSGKLPYVNPPPRRAENGTWELPTPHEARDYNRALYGLGALPESRQRQIAAALQSKGRSDADFDLLQDLAGLSFLMHVSDEANRKKTGNEHAGATTHFYGGRDAALTSAADELDKDFFRNGDLGAKISVPFHLREVQGNGKKHYKKKGKRQ